MTLARYVMIGGFLGAGKTAAVARFAERLSAQGIRVGLITNDQSSDLVDTRILRARGFAVEEIAGGCFCCRFDSLQEAADKLDASTRPEVFVAEPVGSCTDLVATVSYPLRRIYGDRFEIAPLSVLVDPQRAARILGITTGGRSFSSKVVYVYEKQLEEADLIVVNKCDTIDDELRTALVATLEERFPHADVLCGSAKQGGPDLDAWFDRLLVDELEPRATMPLDYDVYAEGEAQLGWYNATFRVGATDGASFDANRLLLDWTGDLRARIAAAGGEVAHLKMTFDAKDTVTDDAVVSHLSVVSAVGTDGELDLRESLLDGVERGALVVNLRAELAPELLRTFVGEVVASPSLEIAREHEEHFRPARPVPTHRVCVVGPEAEAAEAAE